jgi:deoxyribodipyrimidine photolyase-related protein
MTQLTSNLRLILGDQLNQQHSWYNAIDPHIVYVLAELRQETDYARHHVQKVCGYFAAMAAFADWLRQAGHRVVYLTLDDTVDFDSLPVLLDHLAVEHAVEQIDYQQPDEYRVAEQLRRWAASCEPKVTVVDSEHFFIASASMGDYFVVDRAQVMETFYRQVRRETGILMQGAKPLGGKWNFDAENRKKLPPKVAVPDPLLFETPVADILDRLARHKVQTLGTIEGQTLIWPVDRQAALKLLAFFLEQCLPQFGTYQDALTDRGWSLFHSRLSFSLNTKLISPREVVQGALDYWESHQDTVSLPQIEGFVRQIIGWREFMRGVYWMNMPGYATMNGLEHKAALPAFYWTGETKMKCMSVAINQSLDYAYAHHIQRLMVTGNFALLLGVEPEAVDAWYLGIYIDALDWVELPNTRGMSQFADGGLVATKPYISSGKYIQRMGDHCKTCAYDVSLRSGEGACPFNVLYWEFLDRHQKRFATHHRMRMMYSNYERIDVQELTAIKATAAQYREKIDSL